MTEAILHKYVDNGVGCFANVTLAGGGPRVLLSLAAAGFAVFRLHLGGRFPGKRLFNADAREARHMVRVLGRDMRGVPPLPTARDQHQDAMAMSRLIDDAIADIEDVAAGRPATRVENFAVDDGTNPPLAVLTRWALAAPDLATCLRNYERAKHMPA